MDRISSVSPSASAVPTPRMDVNTAVVTPTDQIRWASVLAGLFTVFATLIVLTVLGIAVGLSTYDADNTNAFGLGAGIWGAVSALIAFALGGFMAGRTAAVQGKDMGVLNGAMVWIVAIPLMIYLLGGSLSMLMGLAVNAAGDVAVAGANAASGVIEDAVQTGGQNLQQAATQVNNAVDGNAAAQPGATVVATTAPGAGDTVENAAGVDAQQPTAIGATQIAPTTAVQGAVTDLQQSVSPENIERVAQDVSGGAWGALLALGLSAIAA
ncbi:MAG: hypothetical protein K8I30_01435, partial [Anaerolineae bacterium]|nr:hypothetical protein [Anaerolineae bacterium]